MKAFIITFAHSLKDYGIDMILFIAGIAGGISFLTKSEKLNRLQKFSTVLSGGLTANYLTPLAAEWLNLSDKALYGIAFLLGYGGLKSVETFYIYMHNKFSSTNINSK